MLLRDQMKEVLSKEPRKLIGDIPKKQTIQDLFDTAEFKWGLTEDEVRAAIKAAGYDRWNGMEWDSYVDVLRSFWQKKHIAEQRAQGVVPVLEHIEHLRRLEALLTVEVTKDGWKWVGTEEQMDAHWKLEEMRRKENMRRSYWRIRHG